MKKILLVWLSLFASAVFGWGAEGHRITALMAEDMLSPRARIAVNQLLDGGSLTEAALYMDVYRDALKREIPGSERWHFNNIPVCGEFTGAIPCPDGHCASTQIPRQFAILADQTKTKEERLQALRFMIHLVGDIHQPLHAADDNDLGGNRKPVLMPGAEFPRNLHAVWDSDIVKVATRGLAEATVAQELITQHKKDFANWMRGDVIAWISDSYVLAKKMVYGKLPGFACGMLEGKPAGLFDDKPWPATPYPLPQEYVTGAAGVMPLLLARAGARIGGMLNTALDPDGARVAPRPAADVANPPPPKTNSLEEALRRPQTPRASQ